MQAFKLNLKLIWKSLPSLLIYLVIFIGISLIITNAMGRQPLTPDLLEPVKTNIAVYAEEDTPLTAGFLEELQKTTNFVDLEDSQEVLADAMYWQEIQYILRIPAGFTDSLLAGEVPEIPVTESTGSAAGTYVGMAADKYLNTALLHARFRPGITASELAEATAADLAVRADTQVLQSEETVDTSYAQYYFNYMSYSMMAILILGMGSLILVYKDPELRKRNSASPLSLRTIGLGFFAANLVFALVTWLVFVTAAFLLNYENSLNMNMFWFILNSFCFTLTACALSFLIGTLIKGPGAVDAVSNVVTLGLAFISGVFVPQEFLGGGVLSLARLFPVYWYVSANNRIAGITAFTADNLRTVLLPIAVILGFAALYLIIGGLVMRKNRFNY